MKHWCESFSFSQLESDQIFTLSQPHSKVILSFDTDIPSVRQWPKLQLRGITVHNTDYSHHTIKTA